MITEQSNMKLLLMISKLSFGGAEKQMLNDANDLSENHELTMVTFGGGELEAQLSPKIRLIKLDKTSYWKTAKKLASIVKEHDIELIHSHLFAANIIAVLSAMIYPVKVIWNFHGHMYEAGLKEKITIRLMSKMPGLSKIFFVCSELIDYYREDGYGLPAAKSHVVFNSSELSEKPLVREPQEKLTIGFVGRLVGLKRVPYLLELAAWLKAQDVKDFEIQILGDGQEKEALEKMQNDLAVNEEVRFMGFRSDVPKFYPRFDIFILPSEEEALSLSLIDAGMSAVPSIAFNVGGNDDIVKDGKTGYIVKTKEEMFDRVLKLIQNKSLRSEFGTAARAYCIAHFGKKEHIAILENHYREAIRR